MIRADDRLMIYSLVQVLFTKNISWKYVFYGNRHNFEYCLLLLHVEPDNTFHWSQQLFILQLYGNQT